ncbi:mitochondrial acyl carrier protein [Coemansia sp. RSA 1722]|nr:mitochondrial acyl carrier protein [Coemansia sp. RSA 486]KAJ2235959.1 mitochondrial acyl carrier protein [Coemansia sp. RSA 485]KAJ2590278.1 mitochondrial acyl carrier protein [Coemansia sp. RSA 1722]KAJ2707067.1 mitochondrial acyl carrier protein [Coemansia sp. IMI 203386]KAJ1851168.1 mitochondrial acyl carrier protein [Coemansia sp. RSA 486]
MFRLASFRIAAAMRTAAPRPTVSLVKQRLAMPSMTRWYSAGGAMTRDTIKERIFQVLQDFDKVNQEKLSDVADFNKDLGLDSLDTVEVVMAIEEEFSVEIPDDEADKITTVKEAIEYISHREDAH